MHVMYSASNGIALQADVVSPAWGGKIDSTEGIDPAVLSITADIDRSDEYAIWVRACADDTASDSLWFKSGTGYIQKGLPTNSASEAGKFQWSKLEVAKLAAGSYTLDFIPRENNCMIDKVMITSDLNYTPVDTAPPESPTPIGSASMQFSIEPDEEKLIVLSCRGLRYEQYGNFLFQYNGTDIEIVDIAAQLQQETVTGPGQYGGLQVVSVNDGSILLLPALLPEPDMYWSGNLTVIKVRGLRSCETTVTLTR